MKKYIPRPGVPKPTPAPNVSDTVKRGERPIKKHSPNYKTKAKPRPLPTPGGKTDDGRRGPTPRPLPTPGGKIDDGKRYVGPRPMPTPRVPTPRGKSGLKKTMGR